MALRTVKLNILRRSVKIGGILYTKHTIQSQTAVSFTFRRKTLDVLCFFAKNLFVCFLSFVLIDDHRHHGYFGFIEIDCGYRTIVHQRK